MKPNLFDEATSELSQDAILCWLAAWADPGAAEHDLLLHQLGQAFLKLLFGKHGREVPDVGSSIEIKRQHKSIDILLVIDGTTAVLIEDKVGTTEHSDQLQRYLDVLKDRFAEDRVVPVYIQTREQGSYRVVKAAGFEVVGRGELIALLREYLHQGGSDSIARDFHDYLAGIESRVAAFRSLPFSGWDYDAWTGFYTEVQRQLGEGEWGDVANPSGGFLGYWWSAYPFAESKPYLQIEQRESGKRARLCFKISVDDRAMRNDLCAMWMQQILKAASHRDISVVRPRVVRIGQTMTVAVLSEDPRVAKSNGLLDIDETVGILRRSRDILDLATRSGRD